VVETGMAQIGKLKHKNIRGPGGIKTSVTFGRYFRRLWLFFRTRTYWRCLLRSTF